MTPDRPWAYDIDGEPIDLAVWSALHADPDYCRIALTAIGADVEVSTAWIGIDHSFGLGGPPLVFETMVFGGPLHEEQWRWPNRVAALAGHDQVVALAHERMATA
jgi:hypothetical protein